MAVRIGRLGSKPRTRHNSAKDRHIVESRRGDVADAEQITHRTSDPTDKLVRGRFPLVEIRDENTLLPLTLVSVLVGQLVSVVCLCV
jgi:hypothetical protein